MKLKSLTLENFAKYDKISVNFDENITYLIGPNGSGKSTLGLEGLWFVMQGIAEKAQKGNNPIIGERFRFIGEKTAFAKGEAVFFDEKTKHEITATRHMTKDAQKLTFFAPPGVNLDQQWLNDIFNIFLISPQAFIDLTSKEQAQALNIDTSTYDKKIADLKADLTILNRELKAFGSPVAPEKAERIDVMVMQSEKLAEQEKIREKQTVIDAKNKALKDKYDSDCKDIEEETDKFNSEQDERQEFINTANDLLNSLTEMGYNGTDVQKWIDTLPMPLAKKVDEEENPVYDYPKEPEYLPAADQSKITEIDKKILDSSHTNEKALAYKTYLETLAKKIKKEGEIDTNKTAQKNAEMDRISYLKSCQLPWDNLTIDEEGRLMLDGRPLKKEYWSKGELLKRVPIIMASTMKRDSDEKEYASKLKYVYLEEFNLLDIENQAIVTEYLVKEGFQLVIEYVGEKEVTDKNCIVLQGMQIVNPKPVEDKKPEEKKPNLLF
jgi:DNA repair ATPase RecN